MAKKKTLKAPKYTVVSLGKVNQMPVVQKGKPVQILLTIEPKADITPESSYASMYMYMLMKAINNTGIGSVSQLEYKS